MTLKKILSMTLVIAFAVCFILTTNLSAQFGAVDGVYRRDAWGVGHFGNDFVHPDLHKDFSKYENRFIRLEHPGTRHFNPREMILHSRRKQMIEFIGMVTVLDKSPLDVRLELVPSNPSAGEAFQFVCHITNTSNKPTSLSYYGTGFRMRMPRKIDNPSEKTNATTPYTRGQVLTDSSGIQSFRELFMISNGRNGKFRYSDGGYSHSNCQKGNLSVRLYDLAPGKTMPMVLFFENGVGEGEYEFGLYTGTDRKGKEICPFSKWKFVKIGPPNRVTKKRPSAILAKQASITSQSDDAIEATFTLVHSDTQNWSVYRKGNSREIDRVCGQLQAFDSKGKEIQIKVLFPKRARSENQTWRFENVDESGVPVKLLFQKNSRFSHRKIDKLTLDVLTKSGIETIIVADRLADENDIPPVLFGPEFSGVKIRVRPASKSIKPGEPLRLHLQAVNGTGKPIRFGSADPKGNCLWAELDGKRISMESSGGRRFLGGWASIHTCDTPIEWTHVVQKSVQLKKGKHTLRFIVESNGGVYENTLYQKVPIIKGNIVSNVTTFHVE